MRWEGAQEQGITSSTTKLYLLCPKLYPAYTLGPYGSAVQLDQSKLLSLTNDLVNPLGQI